MNRGWMGIGTFLGLWIVITAMLFPVVWALVTVPTVHSVIDRWAPGSITSPRIFGRVQLGVALALVVGLLRFWQDNPRRFFSGGERRALPGRVFLWLGLGMGMVAGAAWVQCVLGVRSWAGLPGLDVWAGALFTGILVAFLEEFFFRGVLGLAFWKAAEEKRGAWLIGLNAAVFSLAHFLKPQTGPGSGWFSGFPAWGSLELWAGPADPWKLAGLFVAGLVLARLVWQRQNLWAAIGLHAGWVAGLRISEGFWRENPQVSGGWWGPSLEAGPIPFVLLLLLAFALWGRPIRARVA